MYARISLIETCFSPFHMQVPLTIWQFDLHFFLSFTTFPEPPTHLAFPLQSQYLSLPTKPKTKQDQTEQKQSFRK